MASFRAAPGRRVAVFVNGRLRTQAAGRIVLAPHAEIVLEVGPYVPPHSVYHFPSGT
ncbi:MAG: hypothetical protein ACR2NR_06670 [Solirubrobacteraceae bacterium]